ncbi:elongation factor Tu [Streptococcus halotolerans]|uniref:elongation factor Tu n=1 Tax=Streptococcus halotolerans TaxID=1814128 RepID=UPI000788ACFA|nr:elongation factor Tu [Streptococcus halotolerans]
MDYFYLVRDKKQLASYQRFLETFESKLEDYSAFLIRNYYVEDIPKAIIWADKVSATEMLRQIPVPAYTNETRIVMTPDLSVWRDIYLKQLGSYEDSAIKDWLTDHYQYVGENYLLQIVGHELAHWSELFEDDFDDYDSFIWFEEGMVEYISRKYFLTSEEFKAEKLANRYLVDLFQNEHGWHSLNDFGQATYDGNYASIFYEYWRSFLTVDELVMKVGSVDAVFKIYQEWLNTDHSQPLLDWLVQKEILTKEP